MSLAHYIYQNHPLAASFLFCFSCLLFVGLVGQVMQGVAEIVSGFKSHELDL